MQALVSFAVAQLASFHSFLDLPSLFSTIFDDEQQIDHGDQMDDKEEIGNNERIDDEEPIGLIAGDIILQENL
jgi:hypothetical protein